MAECVVENTCGRDSGKKWTHGSMAFADVVVIIPARNEEASIGLVLHDLPPIGHVLVVDNGSSDATAREANKLGASIVQEPIPGYGRACLTGIAAARCLVPRDQRNRTVVVFLDGDYSDYPDLLPELVRPIAENRADFVVGSRLLGDREPGAMPFQSIFGNRLACFLMWLIWGARFTDLGPFRAIRFSSLEKLEMQDTTFGWTIEMQIKAVLSGCRTIEIPVPYRRRIGVSKISGTLSGTLRAGYRILWTIAKFAATSPRRTVRQ